MFKNYGKCYLFQWMYSFKYRYSGPWFNIKMPSYQYRKSHCGDKMILWPSYLHNGISNTGKTTSLYWIRPQIAKFMGPTWGPHGSCQPLMGPMLAPWTLFTGYVYILDLTCSSQCLQMFWASAGTVLTTKLDISCLSCFGFCWFRNIYADQTDHFVQMVYENSWDFTAHW